MHVYLIKVCGGKMDVYFIMVCVWGGACSLDPRGGMHVYLGRGQGREGAAKIDQAGASDMRAGRKGAEGLRIRLVKGF